MFIMEYAISTTNLAACVCVWVCTIWRISARTLSFQIKSNHIYLDTTSLKKMNQGCLQYRQLLA